MKVNGLLPEIYQFAHRSKLDLAYLSSRVVRAHSNIFNYAAAIYMLGADRDMISVTSTPSAVILLTRLQKLIVAAIASSALCEHYYINMNLQSFVFLSPDPSEHVDDCSLNSG